MNNFKLRQGDTFSIDVDISSLATATPSINATGFIYTLTLKLDYTVDTADAQVSKTVDSSDITAGFLTLTLPASVTAQLEAPAKYFWDIEQKQPSQTGGEGIVTTVAPLKTEYKTDKIEVIPDITDNN